VPLSGRARVRITTPSNSTEAITLRDDDSQTHLPLLVKELRRIFSGIYAMELANGALHVRIRPLPGSLIAAGVRRPDGLWLFMDREKPGAVGHAREMILAHPELVVTDGEEGSFLLADRTYDHRVVARFVSELYESTAV
jgi:hypothetical protein